MDTRALTPTLTPADGRLVEEDVLLEELGWVRCLAGRLLADPNDADDVVQEAWLKARSTPPGRFASRGRLRAWLAAVTRRMARDTLRARHRRASREERAARSSARADARDVVERSALLEKLLHAVRALDEPQRSTILLRFMDGHSTAQVAEAMSVSEELVRKRMSRALASLRARLEHEHAFRADPGVLQPAERRRAAWVAAIGLALCAWLGFRAFSAASEAEPDGGLPGLDGATAAEASAREGRASELASRAPEEEPSQSVPEDEPAPGSEAAGSGARTPGADASPGAPAFAIDFVLAPMADN